MDKEIKSEVVHLRVPVEIYRKIQAIANRNDRSVHYVTLRMVKKGLEAK